MVTSAHRAVVTLKEEKEGRESYAFSNYPFSSFNFKFVFPVSQWGGEERGERGNQATILFGSTYYPESKRKGGKL